MTGILLIHGFAGKRDDVKKLYDFFSNRGYLVSSPVLPGHENSQLALANATHKDWIECVENAYIDLSNECEHIVVIGFSMGGLLAVQLYQKYKFAKLITINTPIYYWDIKQILSNLRKDFKAFFKTYWSASTNKPLRSMLHFQLLLSKTKPFIKEVQCESLIIQTQDDDVVRPKSGDYIFKNIPTLKKEFLKIDRGGHMVFLQESSNEIFKKLSNWI